MAKTFLLPVHDIRIAPVLPCGINVLTLCSIANIVRNSHDDIEPIEVEKRDGEWHLVEGRHRWIAHIIGGRTHIRCFEP